MATNTHRATGSASIATTVAPGVSWQLLEVRLKLNLAGGAGNLTATMDAGAGPTYDTNIITEDMTTVLSYVFQPDFPMEFDAGDELDFAWANANGRTYGLEIKFKTMG